MAVDNDLLLKYQLTWARDRLPHDGVQQHHFITNLGIMADVVKEMFPDEQSAKIVPYF